MAKQTRIQHKLKSKHRAVKPRPARPLDKAQEDNHAARREARRAAEQVRLAQEAEAQLTVCSADAFEDGAFVRRFDVIDAVTGDAY
jgi:hypothetical protein